MVNEKLIQEFIQFSKDFFGEKDYFLCLYGSQAYGISTEKSDIDIMFAVRNKTDVKLPELIRRVVDFHVSHQISLDHEVPYENKILITCDELEKAVNLGGFVIRENSIVIPKIVKTKKFLSSPSVKMRLALCALTTPHIVFGNNVERYQAYKNLAERNVVLLAFSLINKMEFDSGLILKTLLEGKNGETGELYLGYKDYPVVTEYMQTFIEKQLKALVSNDAVSLESRTVKLLTPSIITVLRSNSH